MSKDLEIQKARFSRPVRVTMPASVAYDLGAFQKGIAELVERLGCPKCFSGADCGFQLERDFIIDEKLEMHSLKPVSGPDPMPWITVRMPRSVGYDLKKVQGAVAKIAGRLGHPGCCSGFDTLFQQEREFLVDEAGSLHTARF